ncbi:hypothetical protein V6N11_040475 [Hibiscus sabdariffa]|uniref:Uncharacterized protein n=1 Tax=Hibiscus sabdariffa TaxID=183260 RepID=A0ABR2RHL3_9ROSI
MSESRKIQIGLAQNNIFFVPSALEEMVGEIQFRNPTLEELKFVYAFMRTLLWQTVYVLRWPSSALCTIKRIVRKEERMGMVIFQFSMDFSFSFSLKETHHAVSLSGKSENPVEHKNDAPKLPEQGLGLLSGPNINVEALNASEPLPATFTATLPATETINLDPQVEDGCSDIKPQDLFRDDTQFEASKLMKGPNINVEALNPSEGVSTTFTANLPVTEIVNLKPQVEDRVICSDLKPQELFHDDMKSLDLGNNQTPKLYEPEPQANASEPTRTIIGKTDAIKARYRSFSRY